MVGIGVIYGIKHLSFLCWGDLRSIEQIVPWARRSWWARGFTEWTEPVREDYHSGL